MRGQIKSRVNDVACRKMLNFLLYYSFLNRNPFIWPGKIRIIYADILCSVLCFALSFASRVCVNVLAIFFSRRERERDGKIIDLIWWALYLAMSFFNCLSLTKCSWCMWYIMCIVRSIWIIRLYNTKYFTFVFIWKSCVWIEHIQCVILSPGPNQSVCWAQGGN